jgi:hypothetical protein
MDDPQANQPGWQKLVDGFPWFAEKGAFPLPAYSEFMPPPRLGQSPLGDLDPTLFPPDDPYAWLVSEIEEEYELKPGLEVIARQVMTHLLRLGQGQPEYPIAGHERQNLEGNPYWPPELAARAGQLPHERYTSFLALALSRTQDDKGRVQWTLFGGSEQGPERVFWKSFDSAPGGERPAEEGPAFLLRLLSEIYALPLSRPEELLPAGLRILAPRLDGEPLPAWSRPFWLEDTSPLEGVRYLLTFRPFSALPEGVKARYLAGTLALLPFPGSLALWGMPTFNKLQKELPLAGQIPLQRLTARHNGPGGIRVPQTGWLHEPHPDVDPARVQPDLLAHSYIRTHRWDRIHRFEDELTQANPRLEKVLKVLFSTDLDVLGLYDKPMARNCQLWTRDFKLLLDGPNADENDLHRAEAALAQGGLFGYRFQFPAMQVGRYELYWQRPVVAYLAPATGAVELLSDPPLGYLTAYRTGSIDLSHPLELRPRLLRRPQVLSALLDFDSSHDHYAHQTALNLLALFDAWHQLGQRPLPRSFARRLLRTIKEESLEDWLASLAQHAENQAAALRIQAALTNILEPVDKTQVMPDAISFGTTATRDFEVAYWNDIKTLAQGDYQNKDNADCVQDPQTLAELSHPHRDLDRLGDYLLKRHRGAIGRAGLDGQALCGDLPFHWRTDFDYPLFGGWKSNQEGRELERDLLVVIPGKDRTSPLILADHYDTAYMEDLYDKGRGGTGARRAAAGADDNHSATATLLQAAPIYLNLARQGRLERDIWLLHLTGEEFPADCLGARMFCQALIEKNLLLRLEDGRHVDLSAVRPCGIFVMDMIAHNRDSDRDTFQISPGKNPRSLYLARQAHRANLAWNASTYRWNRSPERQGLKSGQRSADGSTIPAIAPALRLDGEVRTHLDPASSLYNTDGQIFSDIGAPVVLFMENYDINRSGYHDTHDTLENIDLDYGAALAAIAIETVARLATRPG